MGALILFSLFVGLDNLQVSAAIGMLEIRAERKWLLTIAFGSFEAIMPLLGLLLGGLIHNALGGMASTIGPLVLMGCGLLIIYMALGEQDTAEVVNSRWLLFGLPLTLSLDNLLAGIGLGALGYPVLFTALVIGLVSASMCFLGLFIGGQVSRWIPVKMELISGSYLVLIAIMMFFFDPN